MSAEEVEEEDENASKKRYAADYGADDDSV